jgi:hypothetical protein
MLWIRGSGPLGDTIRVRFGNHIGSTYGVDSTVAQPFTERDEAIFDPFDLYWKPIPGRGGQWGNALGLFWSDWRGWTSENQIDTFAIALCGGFPECQTLMLRWPDAAYLLARCDSLVLWDVSGLLGWPSDRINIVGQDSLYLDSALKANVYLFRIFKYGARLVDHCALGVEEYQASMPERIELLGNYPNPFNPATTFRIYNPARTTATLRVYDVLGRFIATVFEGALDPGRHALEWDATRTPSGVYIARLCTPHEISVRKMLLIR